jgi:hypothetical protein|tara:strand:+ start:3163 stop:3312 length:150 start_codon:yes stop_codon:yes gene_type:complete
MNDSLTLGELLAGDFTVNLDFEWDTILKLMVGLIIVMVVSGVILKAVLK